jgi:phage shock protein A
MDERIDDLSGMNAAEAKEYVLLHSTSLKLNRKRAGELEESLKKWNSRVELALSQEEADLAILAEREVRSIEAELEDLKRENAGLERALEGMIASLRVMTGSGLSGGDPRLLEQELLSVLGYLPGDEKKAEMDREFRKIEGERAAEEELARLKVKMGGGNG